MPETKAIAPVDEVCKTLTLMEPEFKKALPPQIASAKFIRVAQTALRNSPQLVDLERNSLFAAFHKCAADGLIPDGREAAIVPRKGKAVYMPMVQGICKKARNSGEIKSINAVLVFKNDSYEHWLDETGEHFKHRPVIEDRGDQILTYAYAQTKDGGFYFEEIDMKQMASIEKQAAEAGSAWTGPFKTEMMRKSAIRRLLKYRVPSSTDLDDLIRADDEMYVPPTPEKPAMEPKKTSSRLRDVMDTTATTAPKQTEKAPADVEDVVDQETLPI